jgi:hypothetical protein
MSTPSLVPRVHHDLGEFGSYHLSTGLSYDNPTSSCAVRPCTTAMGLVSPNHTSEYESRQQGWRYHDARHHPQWPARSQVPGSMRQNCTPRFPSVRSFTSPKKHTRESFTPPRYSRKLRDERLQTHTMPTHARSGPQLIPPKPTYVVERPVDRA